MSLSDLASLGSFVSGLAVFASLAFLYFQLRQLSAQAAQTEKNQRAIIHQGRIAQSSDRLLRWAEPTLARAFFKGLTGTEPSTEQLDFNQFLLLSGAILRSVEDVYFQRDLGLVDEPALQNQLSSLRTILRTARGKALWRVLKANYDAHFVERVDAIEASLPVSEVSAFEAFQDELSKIIAT